MPGKKDDFFVISARSLPGVVNGTLLSGPVFFYHTPLHDGG
jgi:hypothetical protein